MQMSNLYHRENEMDKARHNPLQMVAPSLPPRVLRQSLRTAAGEVASAAYDRLVVI